MICPFCQKPIDEMVSKCPHCSQSLGLTAEISRQAGDLQIQGENAEDRRDYKDAIAAYRSSLRFRDSDELKERILRLSGLISQRQTRLRFWVNGGLLTALAGVLIILGLSFFAAKPVAGTVSVTTIEPSRRAVHIAREACDRQDWPLALNVLQRLANDRDWGWAIRDRFAEAKSGYVDAMVQKSLALKKAGDSVGFRRLLAGLARRRLDDSAETVFRLRRAEGLTLFNSLDTKPPAEQEKILREIVALFRPDELKRVYYADDCLFKLARLKSAEGDREAAKGAYKMLVDYCPQGKWYWPAARDYLRK